MSTIAPRTATLVSEGLAATVRTMSPATKSSSPSKMVRPSISRKSAVDVSFVSREADDGARESEQCADDDDHDSRAVDGLADPFHDVVEIHVAIPLPGRLRRLARRSDARPRDARRSGIRPAVIRAPNARQQSDLRTPVAAAIRSVCRRLWGNRVLHALAGRRSRDLCDVPFRVQVTGASGEARRMARSYRLVRLVIDLLVLRACPVFKGRRDPRAPSPTQRDAPAGRSTAVHRTAPRLPCRVRPRHGGVTAGTAVLSYGVQAILDPGVDDESVCRRSVGSDR